MGRDPSADMGRGAAAKRRHGTGSGGHQAQTWDGEGENHLHVGELERHPEAAREDERLARDVDAAEVCGGGWGVYHYEGRGGGTPP